MLGKSRLYNINALISLLILFFLILWSFLLLNIVFLAFFGRCKVHHYFISAADIDAFVGNHFKFLLHLLRWANHC